MALLLVVTALAVAPAGCKPKVQNLDFGDPCTDRAQCKSQLCLFDGPDGEEGVCGQPCEDGNDCPENWSCTGLTQNGELVCQEGPATPFGM